MSRREKEELQNAGTFAALFGFGVIALGLLVLIGIVFPAAAFLVVLAMLLPMLFGMHYLLWGWWFSALAPPDEQDESSDR